MRSPPSTNASRAPTTSSRSTPRSSAKWLRVPAGMHAYGRPRSAAIAATTACEPSPPAIASASAPRSTAPRTSVARSSPGLSSIGSIPRRLASSARWKRSALPPPDFGLKKSTGCCGSGARGQVDVHGERGARGGQGHRRPTTTSRSAPGSRPWRAGRPRRRARGRRPRAPRCARSRAGARRTRRTRRRPRRSPAAPGRAGTRSPPPPRRGRRSRRRPAARRSPRAAAFSCGPSFRSAVGGTRGSSRCHGAGRIAPTG